MRAHLSLPSTERLESFQSKAPISLHFELPYFTLSGLQVRYLKVHERSGYTALPWVRYITQAGDYQLRIGWATCSNARDTTLARTTAQYCLLVSLWTFKSTVRYNFCGQLVLYLNSMLFHLRVSTSSFFFASSFSFFNLLFSYILSAYSTVFYYYSNSTVQYTLRFTRTILM